MKEILEQIWKILKPPRAYSWQTLFDLSLFSALMSAIARGFFGEIIAIFGYIFLIASIAWLGVENNWTTWPWITAAAICLLFWGLLGISPPILIVTWLPLAGAIASITSFISGDLKFRIPNSKERQTLLILLEIQILLACWLQFYFVCTHWLEEYPSLLVDDLSRSNFVVLWELSSARSRGLLILEEILLFLEQQLQDRPWEEVQNWLENYDIRDRVQALKAEAIQKLSEKEEDILWKIHSQLSATDSEYRIKLATKWLGPRSPQAWEEKLYDNELICQIQREGDRARVRCDLS